MDDEQDIHPREAAPRRRLLRVLWNVIGALALTVALLVGAVWFGWKAIGLYPEEVSRWLSGGVGQRVSITSIETKWEGATPRLELHDVTLLDPRPGHHDRALARFESLYVVVDAWASIRSQSFRPAAVTVQGASLMLIRHPDGSLDVQGIQEESNDARGSDALARLFLGHAQVSVRSSRLRWVDRSGSGGSVAIREVDLHLRSAGTRRHAMLSGTIESPGSGRFDVELNLDGDLLTPDWSGEAILNARDLDLAVANAIFGGAGEAGFAGRATLDLSGQWKGGRMVSADGRFHLQDASFEVAEGKALLPEAVGTLELGSGGGALTVESGELEWTRPDVFDQPVSISAFSGSADWRRDAGSTHVILNHVAFENPHLAGSLEGSLDWPEAGSGPVLAVSAWIGRADLRHLPLYLPNAVLDADLRDWIVQAVHGGHLEGGELRVDGALGDWPFDRGEGSVVVQAKVTGVELRYAPHWPSVEALSADMRIEGRRAEFTLREGRVQGADLTRASIEIPHMGSDATSVEIEGELSGTTEQAADFLRNSPLAPRFGRVLDTLEAGGPADLALRISIPLPAGPKQVSGRLEVRDNRTKLPGLVEGLEGVTGGFSFEGAALYAEGVQAHYLGGPVTLNVAPHESEGQVRIEAEGTTTREHLARHLRNAGLLELSEAGQPVWLSRLDGETGWRSVLDLETGAGEHETLASLRVSSDLRGARLDLPPPLAKAPPDSVGVEIELEFDREGARVLHARYGELLSSIFELRDGGAEGGRLERGAIRLGGDTAELPDEEGLVLSGSLPRLSLGEWLRVLRRGRKSRNTFDSGASVRPVAPTLRRVNLQVDELEVFGVPLETTRVDARVDESSTWTASLVGANILGEVRIPAGPEPVLIHMDRLIVPGPTEADDAGEPSPASFRDPAALPAFRFTCTECKLGDRARGTVDIVAHPDPQGIRIQSFYMRGEGYETRGTGTWLVSGGMPESTVDAEVHSDDLGRLLDAFGQVGGESITGATDILLGASWPGSPFDFDLRRLDGVLHFRASDGRLTQVRRGATGRLFGLLMLPSLPRRLALDFRDLFQEGLAYDLMEGSFAIESGDAYTNNFVIESPTATIELAGRTGLVDEDYDQVLTLTPKLSESIALLPIWLGERILNTRVFDRVFAHHFSIRGPWSAPRVEPFQFETQASQRQ